MLVLTGPHFPGYSTRNDRRGRHDQRDVLRPERATDLRSCRSRFTFRIPRRNHLAVTASVFCLLDPPPTCRSFSVCRSTGPLPQAQPTAHRRQPHPPLSTANRPPRSTPRIGPPLPGIPSHPCPSVFICGSRFSVSQEAASTTLISPNASSLIGKCTTAAATPRIIAPIHTGSYDPVAS